MRYNMEASDFRFDEYEDTLPDIVTFGRFAQLAAGLDGDETDELLQRLEGSGAVFDLSDMPKPGAVGQAALRLREEQELVEQGADLRTRLPKEDSLRIYLEETAALPDLTEGQRKAAMADPSLLVNLGMKLSVRIARDYVGYGVLLQDLIQEGNVGMWQLLTDYPGGEPEQVLEHCIRQAMICTIFSQALASGLSERLRRAVEDYRSADERLLMELGRNPTPEEMAEHLHLSVEEVEAVRRTLENARMVDKAHIQPEPEEADAEEEQAVEDTAYYRTRETVNDLMSGLTELETELLNLRYGLNGKPPLSLQETARRLNLTTTQVTETERNALEKMRRQ